MSESVNPYDKLDDHERLEHVVADGRLERKRFLLSSDPELRERLHTVRDIFVEFQKNNPEFVGLTVGGSQVKGYAKKTSDIDLHILIDFDKMRESGRENPRLPELEKLLKNTLHAWGIALHSNWHPVSLKRPDGRESVYDMFGLSLTNDSLRPYREGVISRLEQQEYGGGEYEWRDLMDMLWREENFYFNQLYPDLAEKRKALYPGTLAEARKYYLPERKADTESEV